MMHCVSFCVGLCHITVHVEMDAVTAYYPRLTTVCELAVCDVSHQTVLGASCQQQMRAVSFFH